ncbi:hypothetical protein EV647_0503 [Kribbella sp. VKM Ac-2566]|nr:hypothetical protein EV647_0503 [Kribbella sp. VKM Ac-2566]
MIPSHAAAPWEGWLYLTTVIDMAWRRVDRCEADHLRTELIDDALSNAIAGPMFSARGVSFHPDSGC